MPTENNSTKITGETSIKRVTRSKVQPARKRIPKLMIGVIIVLLAAVLYFFYQYKSLKTNSGGQDSSGEVESVVKEVSKYMLLPDEMPTVATVSDITKLQNQPFFKNAKNGDRVLIYTAARKAIIFDPVAKKIIEVATINIGEQQAPVAPAPVEPTPTTTTEETPEASSSTETTTDVGSPSAN